jgi:mycothiol synthase
MAFTIVLLDPLSPDHVRAAALVLSATSLSSQSTEEELAKEFATTPAHVEEIRYLVFDNDIPIGLARVGTYRYVVDPERLLISVRVVHEYRRRGIGTSLVAIMKPWIDGRVVTQMWASTELDALGEPCFAEGAAFAEKYGMEPRESRFESELDTTELDLKGVAHAVDACAQQGITITTMEALLADPNWQGLDWQRELYDVDCAAMVDEPTEQGGEPSSFEDWKDEFIAEHEPAGMVVAVYEGSIVGLSMHWLEDGKVLVASTGTLAAFRGKGVARAMKLTGAAYAQRKGLPMRAFNQSNNPHIVDLNRSLGFVRKAGYLYWKLTPGR